MGRSQRQKGVRGERDAADQFKEAGIRAHRSAQMQANSFLRSTEKMPDVILPAWKSLWLEVKRGSNTRPLAALRQATAESPKGATPISLCRDDGDKWTATLWLDDLISILLTANPYLREDDAEEVQGSETHPSGEADPDVLPHATGGEVDGDQNR